MDILNFSQIKKETSRIRINECGLYYPERWHWDNTFVDYDFWFAAKGEGTFVYGQDEPHPILPGTCMLFSPGAHILGIEKIGVPIWHIYVHFDFIGPDKKPYHPFEREVLNRTISDIPYLKSTLLRVVRLFNSNKKEQAECLFWTAVSEFCEEEPEGASSPFGHDKYPIVWEICDTIAKNPAHVPSLADLARQYGYSPDYIGRFFNAHIGMSVTEYASNIKINRAKYMLNSTELSVHEIAQTLGYWDVCYFSRQFRRTVGLSPLAYRKKHGGRFLPVEKTGE